MLEQGWGVVEGGGGFKDHSGYWPLEKQPGKRGRGGPSGYKTVGGHPVAAGAAAFRVWVGRGGGGK